MQQDSDLDIGVSLVQDQKRLGQIMMDEAKEKEEKQGHTQNEPSCS